MGGGVHSTVLRGPAAPSAGHEQQERGSLLALGVSLEADSFQRVPSFLAEATSPQLSTVVFVTWIIQDPHCGK